MALLNRCGFEQQTTTAGFEWVANSATFSGVSIDTTTKHGGAASLRCNPTASQGNVRFFARSDSTNPIFIRFYLYIGTAPGAITTISDYMDSALTSACGIRLNSNRTLEFWDFQAAAQVGSDSSALSLNTWYRIEYTFDDGTNTGSARIDGVDFASGAVTDLAGGGLVRVGVATSATCDLYFDDVGFNDNSTSSENSWLGEGFL